MSCHLSGQTETAQIGSKLNQFTAELQDDYSIYSTTISYQENSKNKEQLPQLSSCIERWCAKLQLHKQVKLWFSADSPLQCGVTGWEHHSVVQWLESKNIVTYCHLEFVLKEPLFTHTSYIRQVFSDSHKGPFKAPEGQSITCTVLGPSLSKVQ